MAMHYLLNKHLSENARGKLKELAVLKSANRDRELFSQCDTITEFLNSFNARFRTDFTEIRRYKVSPDGKVLFSTPDSNYASSYSTPRKPSEESGSMDQAVFRAVLGIGGLCGAPQHENKAFLVYPEKNIKGQVTHIYLLGSERLKKTGEKDADKLIERLKSRDFSFEKYLSPIYLENQSMITGDFITDAVFFMETFSQWFHVSKIELTMTFDNRINLDFKKIPESYEYFITQPSDVLTKNSYKKNSYWTFVLKKKHALFSSEKKEVTENQVSYPLLGRKNKHWGTVDLETVYAEQSNHYRFSEMDVAMKRFVKQFGRNAADTLSILNQQDHIARMTEKNKVSYQEARKSHLTNLDNATAFNEILLQIFMSGHILKENEFLTISHWDGKALGLQNEALSHEVADQIIKKYAEILHEKFKPSYHLSGDEFAVLETTDDLQHYQNQILKVFEELSRSTIEQEVTYRDLTKMLVNTLIHSHKASRNDESIISFTAEQLWNKVGIVAEENDPVIKEIKKNLILIFKKLSSFTLSPENILNEKEDLVYFVATQTRAGILEKQIIEQMVRPEHYRRIEVTKESKNKLKNFVEDAQESFLREVGLKTIKISIKMSMTAGAYFIGREKFEQIKKNFLADDSKEIDLKKIYLNLRKETIHKADLIRGEARVKMKDFGFLKED